MLREGAGDPVRLEPLVPERARLRPAHPEIVSQLPQLLHDLRMGLTAVDHGEDESEPFRTRAGEVRALRGERLPGGGAGVADTTGGGGGRLGGGHRAGLPARMFIATTPPSLSRAPAKASAIVSPGASAEKLADLI